MYYQFSSVIFVIIFFFVDLSKFLVALINAVSIVAFFVSPLFYIIYCVSSNQNIAKLIDCILNCYLACKDIETHIVISVSVILIVIVLSAW